MSPACVALPIVAGLLASQIANGAVILGTAETAHLNYDLSGKRSPRWSGGALLVVDEASASSPVIRVFGRDGREASDLTLTIPHAIVITVTGVARGETGLVVACGAAIDAEGRRSPFLAFLPPNSTQERIINLDDYDPQLAAVAPDGSVWLAGVGGTSRLPTGDVLRHFDPDGKFLGSSILASSFSSVLKMRDPHNHLVPAGEGIAFFAPGEGRYIELGKDGRVITDVNSIILPEKGIVTGFASTTEGRILISFEVTTKPHHNNFYSLDRRSNRFVGVTVPSGLIRIYGANGNFIVGRMTGQSLTFSTINERP